MKKTTFTLFAIAIALTIQAQESLTLDSYRQRVLDYSQELKDAQDAVVGATYGTKSAAMGYLPQLDLTADASYDIVLAQNVDDKMLPFDYAIEANFMQTVYAGGAIVAQQRIAKTDLEIAQINEQSTTDNVVNKAEVVYWKAAACKATLANARNYYDVVKELFDIINKRFDEGYVSKSDLLMVNTRLKEAELQLNNAERTAAITFRSFNILMGESPNKCFDVSNDIHTHYDLPVLRHIDEILGMCPDYQMLEKNILKQEYQVSAIHAQFNPKIAIGLKGGWGVSALSAPHDPSWGAVAYATFSFPLLGWADRHYSTRAAKSEITRLNHQKMALIDQINDKLNTAWINLSENYKQIEIAKSNYAIATENLELNTLRYNEGQLPVLDVLSAQLSWIQASNAVVQAEYNYKVAYSDYQNIVGIYE